MGDSDLWRQDGSFRGLQGKSGGGGGGGKGGGKGGKGPEFTRVIPKFLQKYHEPPAIQAKFAPPPMPEGETGEEEEELDDVQKAAIVEFLEKDKAKKDKIANAAGADGVANNADGESTSGDGATEKKKKASQAVVGVGAGQQPKKKRKRKEMTALSNKKLLSFSMDDEE